MAWVTGGTATNESNTSMTIISVARVYCQGLLIGFIDRVH